MGDMGEIFNAMKEHKYDYSKTMPYYCKKCGQCKDYKEAYKNLKVKNVGYGCRDVYCLKKQCIAQYL